MEQIHVRVKKWGNSLGIVLPMKIVEKENLQEGKEIILTVHSQDTTTVKDIFGILKNKLAKVDTQKALRDVDNAFWSET